MPPFFLLLRLRIRTSCSMQVIFHYKIHGLFPIFQLLISLSFSFSFTTDASPSFSKSVLLHDYMHISYPLHSVCTFTSNFPQSLFHSHAEPINKSVRHDFCVLFPLLSCLSLDACSAPFSFRYKCCFSRCPVSHILSSMHMCLVRL